ncbi:MAG: MATE family efflux transporter [Eubacteriales bacterium]
MDQKTNQFLLTEKPGRLMCRYSIPCIISLLVAALYNIVDQIFIANADYLGSYGNAANTVVYPLTVVSLAIAVMIGDGCCSLVSISLGSGDRENAHRCVGNAIVLSVSSSLVLMLLYFLLQEPILTMFGGRVNDETFRLAKEYFTWITAGIPFYMFGQAMNPVIRSDGSPGFAMAATLAGAIANIILDPLFIFGFHWGMMGAAVATVIGQIITAGMSIWYLLHTKEVALSVSSFHLRGSLIRRFLPLGLPSLLQQVSIVAAMLAMQNMILRYGAMDEIFGQEQYAQIPMAVLGIVMKFFQIVISVVVGMSAGCIPVVGYNIGAERKDRVKKFFAILLTAEACVGALSLLIVEIFPRQLIGIFGAANESIYYTDFAVKSFRIYLCMMIFACVNKATFIFLQAMGRAFTSTVLSLIREIVFGVGFALLLPVFFGLDGVLYSMPFSDLLTFVVSLVIIVTTFRSLREK